MAIDRDARKLKVSNAHAHALLWRLIEGLGGAVTVPDTEEDKLPASRYVMAFDDSDGIELVSMDENF